MNAWTRRTALLSLAATAAFAAHAQPYPNKPIRAVVPFAAGSATDQIGRAFAEKMSALLGQPIVSGKRVTGFTNTEEEAVQLTNVVPFLLEDELKRLGGLYEKAGDWESFVVVDERLITGQNPASSEAAARALLKMLG